MLNYALVQSVTRSKPPAPTRRSFLFMICHLVVRKLLFKLALNAEDKKTLKAIQNVEAGKNLSRKFTSVDELMEDLNA